MCKRHILKLFARVRFGAKRNRKARKSNVAQAKPHKEDVFEMWLSAYRNQLEEFCRSQKDHQSNEEPNSNNAEAALESIPLS